MSSSAHDSALNLPILGARENTLAEFLTSPEDEVISLFNQLRAPLLRYTFSLGVHRHDGEDLIQEVFLSLFRHLQHGRPRSNLRGWAFRVAHNLALKQRQSRQKRAEISASGMELAQVAPDTDPEERFAEEQRQEILLTVMRALPEQDQNCLRLRAEGLRYREIAEVLGMSLGAVSNSLARSFERLNRAGGG